jgi:hypothetical protein
MLRVDAEGHVQGVKLNLLVAKEQLFCCLIRRNVKFASWKCADVVDLSKSVVSNGAET